MRISSVRLLAAMGVMLCLGVGCKIIEDSDATPAQDGSSTSAEHVDANALPLSVAAAAKGQVPSGTITRAEKQVIKGKQVYSLTMKDDEKTYDLIIRPDGQVISSKMSPSAKP